MSRNASLYAAAIILTLGPALGVSAAVFSAVNSVLLRPLPISTPEDLIVIWGADPRRHLALVELSHRNVADWGTRSRTLTHVGAMGSSPWPAILLEPTPRRIWSAGVTASFFETLGVRPALGRTLQASDDLPAAAPVAVLSHRLWLSQFSADPAIVGKPLRLEGGPRTIVGVLPPEFDVPRGADFWMPVVPVLVGGSGAAFDGLRDVGVLFAVARLRSGATLPDVRTELDQISDRVRRDEGTHRFGTHVVVTPMLDVLFGPTRLGLFVAAGAVTLLLAVACANAAALLLARRLETRADDALRTALGATRGRLLRARAKEALVLVTGGVVVGLLVAWMTIPAVIALAPPTLLRLDAIRFDADVLWITIGLGLVALAPCVVVSAGYGPALARDVLGEGGRSSATRTSLRTRSLLVVGQTALAGVLLVGAGLVGRSLAHLLSIDLGFDSRQTVVMRVEPHAAPAGPTMWLHGLLRRLHARPDVQAAGTVYLRPLALGAIGSEVGVLLEGQPPGAARTANPALNFQVASEGYFSAMRIPLLRGRTFTEQDDHRAPRVAVVGESTARRLWPASDPIGKRLALTGVAPSDDAERWRTVVGVVSDVRYRGVRDVRLDVYDAALQSPTVAHDLIVRSARPPLDLAKEVISEARALDPDVVVDGVTTMEHVVAQAWSPWQFTMTMLAVLAGMSLVVTSAGVFGLVALDVQQRRQELAVRSALGAQRGDMFRLVLSRVALRAALGSAIGLVLAIGLSRLLRALLVGVEGVDLWVYGGVAITTLTVSLLAAWIPAARAASINPAELLRR